MPWVVKFGCEEWTAETKEEADAIAAGVDDYYKDCPGGKDSIQVFYEEEAALQNRLTRFQG